MAASRSEGPESHLRAFTFLVSLSSASVVARSYATSRQLHVPRSVRFILPEHDSGISDERRRLVQPPRHLRKRRRNQGRIHRYRRRSPVGTDGHPSEPTVTRRNRRSPLGTGGHPSEPAVTPRNRRSPVGTDGHPSEPTVTPRSRRSPVGTDGHPSEPAVTRRNRRSRSPGTDGHAARNEQLESRVSGGNVVPGSTTPCLVRWSHSRQLPRVIRRNTTNSLTSTQVIDREKNDTIYSYRFFQPLEKPGEINRAKSAT